MSSPNDVSETGYTEVTNKMERRATFDELVAHTTFVTGVAGSATILLRATRIEALRLLLFLEVVEESELLPGGSVYKFSFHIESGQFQFEAPLRRDGVTPSIDLTKIVLQRLQRRNNFRTSTGPVLVHFTPRKALASGAAVTSLKVHNVSVGGFGVVVNDVQAATLSIGQHVDGTLQMGGREDLKVKTIIRHIDAMEHGTQKLVGFEVLEMDQSTQRDLLSMGLQIHRETKLKL